MAETKTKPKATEVKRPRGRPRKKIETRGGTREGAGRKPSGNAKVRQQIYISQLTKTRCEKLRERGFDFSTPFENLIAKYAEALGIE